MRSQTGKATQVSELLYALPPLRLGLFFQSLAHGPKALSLVMSSQALTRRPQLVYDVKPHVQSRGPLAVSTLLEYRTILWSLA